MRQMYLHRSNHPHLHVICLVSRRSQALWQVSPLALNDNDNVPNDNKDGDIKKINFFAIAMAIDIMSIYTTVTKCVIRKRIICSQTYFPKNTELQMEALKGMSIKKACEWCDVIGNEKLLCLETKKLKR